MSDLAASRQSKTRDAQSEKVQPEPEKHPKIVFVPRHEDVEGQWRRLSLEACMGGHPVACDEIDAFIRKHQDSPHVEEGRKIVEKGRAAFELETKKREEAYAKAAEVARKEAEEAARRERATRVAPPAQPADPCHGHVQCCDGTCSPSCTTVHRGCCSHHGGVCG